MSSKLVNPVKRALISVSDKTGLEFLARGLAKKNVQIISTGGTQKFLQDLEISVQSVSELTGYPEIMGGRVKTLHPGIHGAILGRREIDNRVMEEQGIEGIDLVVVNLYPFRTTIATPGTTFIDAIENIDIGGPTMIRGAAKNHKDVAVIVNHEDYALVLNELESFGGITPETRFRLAVTAFAHTAEYDTAIANYFASQSSSRVKQGKDGFSTAEFPEELSLSFTKQSDLRYGENPHQRAAFYTDVNAPDQGTLATARQWQGKALSYNNIADTDAAMRCVNSFSQPACVIVKHANPCGVATGDDSFEAYQRAFMADSTSAFGGIIAFNRLLDDQTAQAILDNQFAEVIIAPEISDTALKRFSAKKNLRVLSCETASSEQETELCFKRVSGGVLVQETDCKVIRPEELKVVTKRAPTQQELADMLFSWNVVRFVKSNAIVLARNGQTVGIGAGQMSRIDSAKIAATKACEHQFDLHDAVMASDAFFPFRDGVDSAVQAGIRAIIQPGGSIRDQEIIAAADEHSVTMVFTGIRHFLH